MVGERILILSGMLTIASGVVGIFSTLRSNRLAKEKFALEKQQAGNQHRTSLIDDVDQVLQVVKEENGRLAERVERLEKENKRLSSANAKLTRRVGEIQEELASEKLRRASLEERLDIERDVFSQQIEKLEKRLAKYENEGA